MTPSSEKPIRGRKPFISTPPVTHAQAVEAADKLDTALREYSEGRKRLGNLPLEAMAQLIQFARDSSRSADLLPAAIKMNDFLTFECRNKHHADPLEADVNPDWHIELTISIGELREFTHAVNKAKK